MDPVSRREQLQLRQEQVELRQRELDARWAEAREFALPLAVRARIAEDFERLAAARDDLAAARDEAAVERDALAEERDAGALERDRERPLQLLLDGPVVVERIWAGRDRDGALGDRSDARRDRRDGASGRTRTAGERGDLAELRRESADLAVVAQQELVGLLQRHVLSCQQLALSHELSGALYEQLALREDDPHRLPELTRRAAEERTRAAAAAGHAQEASLALEDLRRR